MAFSILTFLTALALAAVAGWFSIAGIMTIYAGAPLLAAVLGIVTECGKLVTTSWLYRNWKETSWKLKIPLIYFTVTLMIITSIGVFGFLSKAHLEQNSSTIDNTAKIEQLNRQIEREKSIIADSERVIGQLDTTVNSFLGKDRADRGLAVRRSQANQRAQLRQEIAAAQKRIDELSEEKFKYESEIRKLELEVGPIRYIAELAYGKDGDQQDKLESAVKIFTLLIVSTLDPLAIVLLVAANSSWQRRNQSKKTSEETVETPKTDSYQDSKPVAEVITQKSVLPTDSIIPKSTAEPLKESPPVIETDSTTSTDEELKVPVIHLTEEQTSSTPQAIEKNADLLIDTTNQGSSEIEKHQKKNSGEAWAQQADVLAEILGSKAHFTPKKLLDKTRSENTAPGSEKKNKYPSIFGWIDKFGESNGK